MERCIAYPALRPWPEKLTTLANLGDSLEKLQGCPFADENGLSGVLRTWGRARPWRMESSGAGVLACRRAVNDIRAVVVFSSAILIKDCVFLGGSTQDAGCGL